MVSVLSPQFLFNSNSFTVKPFVKFKYNHLTEACCDKIWFEYSLDDLNWLSLGSHNSGQNWYNDSTVNYWSGNSNGWNVASHQLEDVPYGQNVRFRFRFYADFSVNNEGFAFDDFEVLTSIEDAGITSVTSPSNSACGFSGNEPISVAIKNHGLSAINGITVNYQINTLPLVSQTLSNLDTGDAFIFTFTQGADLSADGIYNLKVSIGAGDDEILNDTLEFTIENLSEINQFPYVENFESGQGSWEASGMNSTWAFGEPAKQEIRGAYSGQNAWVTGSLNYGFYNNNEKSFVLSPCFNTSTLSSAQVRMAVYWSSESEYDGANLEYTIDNGLNWIALEDPNGFNWYNKNQVSALSSTSSLKGWSGNDNFNDGSKGYKLAGASKAQMSGQNSLRFRVNFASDINTRDEGFAFDDFTFGETVQTDLALIDINRKTFELCQNASDSLWAYFQNLGQSALDSFSIQYIVGAQQGSKIYSNSLSPGQTDSLFIAVISATDTGKLEMSVFSNVTGDAFNFNDSIRIPFNVYSDKPVPLTSNVQICDTSRALLTAQGEGLSKWYSDQTFDDLVYVGDTFLTGLISADTTFYIRNTKGVYDTIGPKIRGFGPGSYSNVQAEVYLEVKKYTTLASARIFAQNSGSFTIQIENLDDSEIQDKEFIVPSTGQRNIYMGFDLKPGSYVMRFVNWSNTTLYRNTDSADYKGYLNDHIAITGNNFDPDFYYYLYNLIVVKSEPCPGESSVTVNVGNVAPTANFNYTANKNRLNFYNTSQSGRSFKWLFENLSTGDIDSVKSVNPELSLDTGNYDVSLIAINDCGSDTATVNFQIGEISGFGNVFQFPV
jgi:hypothetical protein